MSLEMECVLRVSGVQVRADVIRVSHPDVDLLETWTKGDARPGNLPPVGSSGASFALPRLDSPAFQRALIRALSLVDAIRGAKDNAVSKVELDVGITLEPKTGPMLSVSLSPSVLTILGDAGVELRVTAYVSDD